MSTDINPETGEITVGRSPRFTTWTAFLVFSIVTLGASVEVVSTVPVCLEIILMMKNKLEWDEMID